MLKLQPFEGNALDLLQQVYRDPSLPLDTRLGAAVHAARCKAETTKGSNATQVIQVITGLMRTPDEPQLAEPAVPDDPAPAAPAATRVTGATSPPDSAVTARFPALPSPRLSARDADALAAAQAYQAEERAAANAARANALSIAKSETDGGMSCDPPRSREWLWRS